MSIEELTPCVNHIYFVVIIKFSFAVMNVTVTTVTACGRRHQKVDVAPTVLMIGTRHVGVEILSPSIR